MTFPQRDLARKPIRRNEHATEPADSAEVARVPFQIGGFEFWKCHSSELSDSRRSLVRCGTPKGVELVLFGLLSITVSLHPVARKWSAQVKYRPSYPQWI